MPVHNPPETVLDEAIASVLVQTYPHWECCIADDASTEPHVRIVLERYVALDPRVRVVYRPQSGHIAAASNSALDLARGEFVVLLDHDDRLAPEALGAIAEVVAGEPLVDLIYSDEDKLDPAGRRVTPFFKPAWSPALLLSCNYVTHLAAARRELVAEVGGFRTETVGSQDHDLFLRLGERARAVAHIPRILYSWRMVAGSTAAASSAKPYTVVAARRALAGALREHAPLADLPAVPRGGLSLWVALPGRADAATVAARCLQDGLAVSAGEEWFPAEPDGPHLRLGYAAAPQDQFERAAQILGRVLEGVEPQR
jgi:glycosyltransferase involved in cell wall biosynthesis